MKLKDGYYDRFPGNFTADPKTMFVKGINDLSKIKDSQWEANGSTATCLRCGYEIHSGFHRPDRCPGCDRAMKKDL